MPLKTQDFLTQYQTALRKTLTSYLSEDHNALEKLRITITLHFLMDYNQRLLDILHKLTFLPNASHIINELLCVSDEDDNMLTYYEKISEHMVHELNPHVEKISDYMLLTLFATVSFRLLNECSVIKDYNAAAALALICYFVLLGLRTSIDCSVSEFISFSKKDIYTPLIKPTPEALDVLRIKQWFERRHVFFNQSLADAVNDTIIENMEPDRLPQANLC